MWIEIGNDIYGMEFKKSRPARALWIEIENKIYGWNKTDVEAREGLVD